MSNIPVTYDFKNLYNSSLNPSAIHTQNTGLFYYFGDYLLKKVMSCFDFDLPDTWPSNYFKYTLFGRGFLAVFNTAKYGDIFQNCTIGDNVTLYYQPKFAIVANPVLGSLKLDIGTDCEILKLQPDFSSVLDIVGYYADMMAVASETIAVNLLNSRVSYTFLAENKAMAETFKKMYDQMASGRPFTVVDKDVAVGEDGVKSWDFFVQNVGQNYIVDHVLDDLKKIEDQFNTRVGIPNANTQKKERMISNEVEANDIDTQTLVNLWLDTMREDIDKINAHFGLDLAVRYRYEYFYEKEGADDGDVIDQSAL